MHASKRRGWLVARYLDFVRNIALVGFDGSEPSIHQAEGFKGDHGCRPRDRDRNVFPPVDLVGGVAVRAQETGSG